MDAPAFASRLDGFARGIDVLGHAPRKPANDPALDFFGNAVHRGEIALADDGESSLDDIHLQAGELAGHFELLAQVHGGAGTLLAIAERGVEDDDFFSVHNSA